jgi:predicted AlkP superfamily phosphohydrolase/phosphomutase
MGSEIPVRKTPAQLEEIRRNLVAGAQRKSELTRWVLEQGPWDFFLTVFGETHRGGHILWPETESEGEGALLDVYRAVDRAVGEVFDLLRQRFATVMVFALHGMGRNTSQEHFMPRFMDRVNAGFMAGNGSAAAAAPVQAAPRQRGLVRLLRERVPPAVQNAIARAVPVAVRDAVVSRQISGGHDWERTPGLALLADLNGYLRWNLRGRERFGMLAPGAPEQIRYVEGLVGALRDLRVDDGDRLVSGVRFARDDYPGKRSHHLPDAIVRWGERAPVSRVRCERLGEIRGDVGTGRGGNHRFEGFCVLVDNQPRAAGESGPRHIKDLAALAVS